jgi:Xaa-Pro aminopeptidase
LTVFLTKTQGMNKSASLALCLIIAAAPGAHAQEGLPTDYLSKEFHAGRREALRKLMPANSVAVIFAFPPRLFSNDNNYPYHTNPDL